MVTFLYSNQFILILYIVLIIVFYEKCQASVLEIYQKY